MPFSFSFSRLVMSLRSGIVPERSLPQSQSSVMSVMVFSHAGTLPVSPLPGRYSSTRLVPLRSGISPVCELLCRFSTVRFDR